MKTFVASSPKVEVNGETIYSIIDGMGSFKTQAEKILAENGINAPKVGSWYNQQAWLNAFKSISEKIGKSTLFNIGQKIPENALFPPEIDNIHKALASIDVAYHINHRGGEIGHYQYSKTGEQSCRIVCDNPYPDEFDKGIITALCRKFQNRFISTNVIIDENQAVRSKGGNSTTFLVSWK